MLSYSPFARASRVRRRPIQPQQRRFGPMMGRAPTRPPTGVELRNPGGPMMGRAPPFMGGAPMPSYRPGWRPPPGNFTTGGQPMPGILPVGMQQQGGPMPGIQPVYMERQDSPGWSDPAPFVHGGLPPPASSPMFPGMGQPNSWGQPLPQTRPWPNPGPATNGYAEGWRPPPGNFTRRSF